MLDERPRLSAQERARIEARRSDPEGIEAAEREADRERTASRRLWAGLMVARDVDTCTSILRGRPVRVGNLDRFVLRRAFRGGRLLCAEAYLIVAVAHLDAIAEAGSMPERRAGKR